jgi:hypothetical protein
MQTTFLQFINGRFLPLAMDAVPAWISSAVQAHEPGHELDRALSATGSRCNESFGTSQSVDVWKDGQSQTWFAQWYDDDTTYANIVIVSLVDFLVFQSQWLAPMACKIMAEDKYCEWRQRLSAA